MSDTDIDVDRILSLLRDKIRERGFTQREVQNVLGWSPSYLSTLFAKHEDLEVMHILQILEVIGVAPRDFYAELYGFPRQRSSGEQALTDSVS